VTAARELFQVLRWFALLLDTSLWIDFTPARSPASLKQFIAPFVLDPEAHLAEPVHLPLLRSARPDETRQLEAPMSAASFVLIGIPIDPRISAISAEIVSAQV